MTLFRDIGNILFKILPVSGFFGLKREILKKMGAEVGEGVSINGHSWFYGHGKIQIGADTWLGVGCKFYSVAEHIIEIGKNCDIAPEVIFVSGSHKTGGRKRRAGEGYALDIKIGDGGWIGARVTILGGVTIGSGVVVAAGSVVCSDLPDNCLAAGVPAIPKKFFTD